MRKKELSKKERNGMGKGRGSDRSLAEHRDRTKWKSRIQLFVGGFLLGFRFNKILNPSFSSRRTDKGYLFLWFAFIMLRIKPRALTGQAIHMFYHLATSLALQNISFYSFGPTAVPRSDARAKVE